MSPGEENNGLTEDENKELERNYRLRSKMINNEKFSKNILARIEIINISINIIYNIYQKSNSFVYIFEPVMKSCPVLHRFISRNVKTFRLCFRRC